MTAWRTLSPSSCNRGVVCRLATIDSLPAQRNAMDDPGVAFRQASNYRHLSCVGVEHRRNREKTDSLHHGIALIITGLMRLINISYDKEGVPAFDWFIASVLEAVNYDGASASASIL